MDFQGDLNTEINFLTRVITHAFFPFPDNVEVASKSGISCIIQPGGSIRDAEVIDAANDCGIPMVFTGMRHFLH